MKRYYVRCKDHNDENASLVIEAASTEEAKRKALDIHKVKIVYNVSIGEGRGTNYLQRKHSPYIKNNNSKAVIIFS
ncbi:hypothetical protein C1N92_20670 [Bacillus velezensis]|nr:hypothetical protein C0W57_07575 [Bacillus velezensis]AWQ13407.1 hypothetical protein C1N92_00120 [Bacillus velezensis]AWQ17109.1 hypothetical protein C1N92_20670 [Bacillus velezensis]OXS81397.1 hypothetical protein B1726_16855 [Bacillus sp. LYLB4]POI16679.1 hypothetical protein C2145_11395 [Bacillus velezensis]